ncbi:hypothetical protein F2P81_007974 [Scophthalmus maximus]|uniref:C2H2-type domain-containing protein n=1 Tax=Scophthalmus maximus TaxID=52904 RepID=A0A6A4T4B3_SCOMX|nr:hypothetical protein F2P81_007974 [Scophthalmus maximus]
MSDYLTRGFRAQLDTAMESVLRRAVCEVMKIFESSLRGHQMELAQKGEEVAHLKVKLQTAEIKLRERECGGDGLLEVNETQMSETQRELGVVVNPLVPTSDVPEIDFEVPDDWCAPLGDDTVAKQDDAVCPSVRLRPLLIPLCRIPIIKQEVTDCDIHSDKLRKDVMTSRRGSALNERHMHTQDNSLPTHKREIRRRPMRNDMNQLLKDIKLVYSDQTAGVGVRTRGRNLIAKEQNKTVKGRREEGTTKSESTEQERVESDGAERYSCKYCKKLFDTDFGRRVHIRSHKRCRACKKEFLFPSALKCHKLSCKKLKKMLAKRALPTDTPKPEICGEEKATSPSNKQVIIKKESSPLSGNHSESLIHNDGSTGKYLCAFCKKTFPSNSKLKEHERVHTGEKPYPCFVCQKKFRVKQSLKKHMLRMHRDQINSSEAKGDPTWTVPPGTEDNLEDSISLSKDNSRTISRNNVRRRHNSDMKPSHRWQTMGVRTSKGFICLTCQKFTSAKHLLIEHFRIHTGERPIKCQKCLAKFRTYHQLYTHRKRCCNPLSSIQCEKCDKVLPSKAKYNRHVSKCKRDQPNALQGLQKRLLP